ncbi:TPA: radical SAM protein, partial [Candidatus Poribacteria bacterium]|nr:radical SAM protein [Candidatus Poribacteria bacterium]
MVSELVPLPTVRYVTSGSCIAHCPFCHREGLNGEERINQQRLAAILSSLKTYGFNSLTIAGGDPPNIGDVIWVASLFRSVGFKVGFTTSGLGLEYSEWSEISPILDKLHISVPALNPVLYKSWTGFNLEAILEQIKFLREFIKNLDKPTHDMLSFILCSNKNHLLL